MSQLNNLTTFITDNLPPEAMQMFSSAMDDCQLIRSSKGLGLEQRRIGVLRYNALLSWDNFPYRLCSPGEVYALVLAWLEDYANDLHDSMKLEDPTVDPEFVDENSCILEITVPLADPIIIRKDANGSIPLKGQRWQIDNPEIWTAESIEVVVTVGSPS